jgi:hypothetical protein
MAVIGRTPTTRIKSGVRRAPPPTPVSPTRVPMNNPRLVKIGSIILGLLLTSKDSRIKRAANTKCQAHLPGVVEKAFSRNLETKKRPDDGRYIDHQS